MNLDRMCIRWMVTALAAGSAGFCFDRDVAAQEGPADVEEGVHVLMRGPVHEAFAEPLLFNPEPGIMVQIAPPGPIEEVPPEQRLEGDNVAWIPGYWAWDDEANDFLWVSGIWRALPPDRQWVPGYWSRTGQGYQWISGYWAEAAVSHAEYLPEPPESLEVGPNVAAPSDDYIWAPGCWVWQKGWFMQPGRYLWRPGYWAKANPDWDWIPACYVWTPRGWIFVDSYWDYPVSRRGILFAPVRFDRSVYTRRGFSYSPRTVINPDSFSDQLFLRPRSSHYYFGDYYSPDYYSAGFYPLFSADSSRYGYDPIYTRTRWDHRRDHDWDNRVQEEYRQRRDHKEARPPRTWEGVKKIGTSPAISREKTAEIAASLDQWTKKKDSPMRFKPLAGEERQKLVGGERDVQKFREERNIRESKKERPPAEPPVRKSKSEKVKLPKSPIVAKPAAQLGKGQSPPKKHEAPKPDPKIRPGTKKEGGKPEPPGEKPKDQSKGGRQEPPKRASMEKRKDEPQQTTKGASIEKQDGSRDKPKEKAKDKGKGQGEDTDSKR